MTDIQAAVGREQLKRLPEIVAARRRLAARYTRAAAAIISASALPHEPAWARSNWQSYCVRLPDRCDQRARDAGHARCQASRRGAASCARIAKPAMPGQRPRIAVHSEAAQDHCIILPLYPQMTDEEQDTVVKELKSAVLAQMGAVPAK